MFLIIMGICITKFYEWAFKITQIPRFGSQILPPWWKYGRSEYYLHAWWSRAWQISLMERKCRLKCTWICNFSEVNEKPRNEARYGKDEETRSTRERNFVSVGTVLIELFNSAIQMVGGLMVFLSKMALRTEDTSNGRVSHLSLLLKTQRCQKDTKWLQKTIPDI